MKKFLFLLLLPAVAQAECNFDPSSGVFVTEGCNVCYASSVEHDPCQVCLWTPTGSCENAGSGPSLAPDPGPVDPAPGLPEVTPAPPAPEPTPAPDVPLLPEFPEGDGSPAPEPLGPDAECLEDLSCWKAHYRACAVGNDICYASLMSCQ